jgi:hypothetical protein
MSVQIWYVVCLSGVRPCVRSSYVSKSATNHYDILYAILYDMSTVNSSIVDNILNTIWSSYVSKSATNHYDILYAILYDMSTVNSSIVDNILNTIWYEISRYGMSVRPCVMSSYVSKSATDHYGNTVS